MAGAEVGRAITHSYLKNSAEITDEILRVEVWSSWPKPLQIPAMKKKHSRVNEQQRRLEMTSVT
jgi:hypothetical protein